MKLSDIYKKSFEKQCFQLLVDAYNTSLAEKIIQIDWTENDISQELYEKINVNPRRLKWNIAASREFHLSKQVIKTKGFADKLSRVDLRISSISNELECNYFCEAKRLKETDSKLKRGYINEGMDRFISKKYPMGCMLGYVLEGKENETIKGINSLIEKDKRQAETLNLKSNKLIKSYYESIHSEIGILKHLIFDFTNISN